MRQSSARILPTHSRPLPRTEAWPELVFPNGEPGLAGSRFEVVDADPAWMKLGALARGPPMPPSDRGQLR
ncbi:MAG: hypothetical protein JO168_17995 [Solirubrobacterales bacterium]|nr:hypothetical protein [Solirubrobacterales bacterium]MBV9714273.1 hypothetical protein [Solirubrobacterales bacterium]